MHKAWIITHLTLHLNTKINQIIKCTAGFQIKIFSDFIWINKTKIQMHYFLQLLYYYHYDLLLRLLYFMHLNLHAFYNAFMIIIIIRTL